MALPFCPNKSHPDWIKLVEKVGETEAYYQYDRNNHDIPRFAISTVDDAFNYVASFSDISKRGEMLWVKSNRDISIEAANISSVAAKIAKVNNVFPNLLILDKTPVKQTEKTSKYSNGRKVAYFVDINPEALVEYKQQFEIPKGQTQSEQEQRPNDRLTKEERTDFEKKKEIMLKSFPFVNEVIEDYNTELAGYVQEGGNVIVVNPNKWTKDTIGHEFAHILIDSIGGLSNPLIARGLELLRDSDVWNETMDRYPDLVGANRDDPSDVRIYKEILAQAIGEETVRLYDETKQNLFQRWLNRLFAKIRQWFGLKDNEITQLARKVIQGTPVLQDGTSDYYEQRGKVVEDLKKESSDKSGESDLRKTYNKILESLRKKHGIYDKSSKETKTKSLETILKKIQNLDNNIPKAIETFATFAINQTNSIYAQYSLAKTGKGGIGEEFTIKQLATWNDYVSGFKSLEDLAAIAEGLAISVATDQETADLKTMFDKIPDTSGWPSSMKGKTISEAIDITIKRYNEIKNFYKSEGKKQVTDWLMPYSKHIEAEFKEKLDKEYNSLPKAEKSAISKDKYIEEQLGFIKEEIEEKTKEALLKELDRASRDVNVMERYLDNILDSPDMVTSAMVNAFTEVMFNIRTRFNDLNRDLVDLTRRLEDQLQSTGFFGKSEDAYDFFLEKDKFGNLTGNMVDYVHSDFWEIYESYKNKLSNQDIGEDERKRLITQWLNENAPTTRETRRKRSKDIIKMIEGLYNDKIIDEREKSLIISLQDELRRGYATIDQLDINEDAMELYNSWMKKHSWDYRVFNKEWLNPQWFELVELAGGDIKSTTEEQKQQIKDNKSNNVKVEFYNFINEKLDSLEKNIPFRTRIYNRLPGVVKDVNERLKSNGLQNSALFAVTSTFDVLADEDQRGTEQLVNEAGDQVMFLPVYYSNNLKRKYKEQFQKLKDEELEKVINSYKNAYQKESDTVKKALSLNDYAAFQYIKTEAAKEQSFDVAGIYSKYFHSAIDYSEKHEILPKMEMAKFLAKERQVLVTDSRGKIKKDKQTGADRVKEGIDSNIYKQLSDWYEALMFGMKEKDEGTWFNGKVDRAKVANALNKFTSLNLLGLNVVQGTANVILGKTNQFIESAGGKFYSPKDLIKAKLYYNKHLMGIMGDIGTRYPKDIVNLLNLEFDILNEYQDGKFRKNSKFRQLLSTNTLFFTTHAGEHLMQTKVMLAMLNKMEAKDANGNVLGTMLDMVQRENIGTDKNPKYKLTFKSKDGVSVANFGTAERVDFNNKVKRVLSSIHGEYTQEGRVAIQRYALGRMAFMFRKFIPTGIRRRWGRKRVNNLLGENVEGMYITWLRFVKNFYKDLLTFKWSLTDKDLTSTEISNIRKAFTEILFLIGATILAKVLLNMKNDDEDDDWFTSFLAYQALRYKTELWFFINPSEALKIMRSPAASMSVIENTIKLVGDLTYPLVSGEFRFDVYERGNWKGKPKIAKTTVNFIPAFKQLYRLKYVDDQINWLAN